MGIIRASALATTGDAAGANAAKTAVKTRPSPPMIGPTPPKGERSILVAWDPVNQKERWSAAGGGRSAAGRSRPRGIW